MNLGDDVGDCLSYAWDFGEPFLFDQAVEGSASPAKLSAARA